MGLKPRVPAFPHHDIKKHPMSSNLNRREALATALSLTVLPGIGKHKDLCTALETKAGFVEPEPAKKN
jgi:hypothetical protein